MTVYESKYNVIPSIGGIHDQTKEYENLVIVTDDVNTYISKDFVPKNTPINDSNYWFKLPSFNSQIEDIRTYMDKIKNMYTNISESLFNIKTNYDGKTFESPSLRIENIEKILNEVNKKISIINESKKGIFKPNFSMTMQWSELKTNETKTCLLYNQIKEKIDNVIKLGCNSICVTFRSGIYNNEFTLADDVETYKQIFEYCKSIGVKIECLKLHLCSNLTDLKSIIGEDMFIYKYKELVNRLADEFKDYNINMFIAFNEYPQIYMESNYLTFVTDVLDSLRTKGYKTGISISNYELQTYDSNNKILGINDGTSDLYHHIDYFCINSYPQISRNKEKITHNDVINSMINSETLYPYFKVKENNPNLKLIISEIGVQDYYIALSYPAYYRWGSDAIPQNGAVQALYLTGIFETFNEDFIHSVYWYYDINSIELPSKVIKKYIRGE